jgi:transcription-repair coupling factor (superfamily II helicase)
MSLAALGGLLEGSPAYQTLRRALEGSRVRARAQVLANATPYVLADIWQSLGVPVLVVTPRPEDARSLHEQMLLWTDRDADVLHFPETEVLPFERQLSDVDTTHQRLRVLSDLRTVEKRSLVVIASAAAIAQRTIDAEAFASQTHTLSKGDEVDLVRLLDRWRQMGYQFEPTVYAPGFASRRGGILDLYPVGSPEPARIELWGNEIDTIRLFDPDTQRSTDMVDSIEVGPARETLPAIMPYDRLRGLIEPIDFTNCTDVARRRVEGELGRLADGHDVEDLDFYAGLFNMGCLLDHFPRDGLLVMNRPSEILEAAREADERSQQLRDVKQRRGELPLNFPSSHFSWEEIVRRAGDIHRRLDVLPWGADDLVHRDIHVLPFASAPAFLGKLDSFAEEVHDLARDGQTVIAVTSHSRRLGEIFSEYGIAADVSESLEVVPDQGSITALQAQGAGLRDGFVLTVDGRRLAVFSDAEIFGVTKQRRITRRTSARRNAFLEEISPGDYVVHVEHGIGRFTGTGHPSGDGDGTEYLVLQYAQGDKLYVPMEHLDRVTAYIAPMDRPPSLTRLGTQEWKRTKERVAQSTREMAAELLSLYAARELAEGHGFPQDAQWQAELDESFPYEETPDQLAAIAEIKADMESTKPMDRLVCGDVGYGKTEIALRAAFKAVMAGKQVAMLVPTTVLAQQHYATFSERLSAYPTIVEVLSRFRTDGEQRQIVEGLASGRVDICIGTHRLIQKDVRFKDLGLVIIDEEQRFGVAHKERLKQMRREVDVLTSTATPIPRTLHMSLAGVRDMSTMETPPEERLPIKTYVSEFSDELIREAILRELDRQGQVYFLHNRVHNIDYMAAYIGRMVPEATVGIAHGQMPEGQLELTMTEFAEGKMDVLVCTTIIESGLDIPNVNTLIINRADTFGLAQLYQLRGRVGRSARRAYAYLLVPEARSLTEPAEKRLRAMLGATELGSGFRIAMKDLEIRGAGNILGSQQSGYIHAVGFDLYTRLLSTAVEDLRAQAASGGNGAQADGADVEPDGSGTGPDGILSLSPLDDALAATQRTSVELGVPSSIPDDYVTDLTTRIGIYQRLVKLEAVDDVDDMETELRDRFGELPWQARNLLYVVRLKLRGQAAGVESIARQERRIVLRLQDQVGGARQALQRALGRGVTVGNSQIRLDLDKAGDKWEERLAATVDKLAAFRERLMSGVPAASS